MKRLAVACLILLTACDGVYRVVVPFCPRSDSAWAAADSVPLGCALPDTTQVQP